MVPLLPLASSPRSTAASTRIIDRVAARVDPRARPLRAAEDARQRCGRPAPSLASAASSRRSASPRRAADAVGCGRRRSAHGAITVTAGARDARPHSVKIEAAIRERMATVAGRAFLGRRRRPGEKLELMVSPAMTRGVAAAAATVETAMRAQPQLAGITSIGEPGATRRSSCVRIPRAPRSAACPPRRSARPLAIATSGDFDQALAKLESRRAPDRHPRARARASRADLRRSSRCA